MRRLLETWAGHFRWFVLALAMVCALTVLVGYRYLRTYDAQAALWVDSPAPTSSDPAQKGPAELYGGAFQQLLQTRSFREAVLKGVAARNGLSTSDPAEHEAMLSQIGRDIKVTASGANLIQISSRERDPGLALAMVAAAVDEFQKQSMGLRQDAAQRVLALYEARITQAQSEVAAAQQRLSALPASAGAGPRAQLAAEIQTQQDLLKMLQDQHNQALARSIADGIVTPGMLQVLDSPHLPLRSSTDLATVALLAAAALLATLTVSLGATALLTARDHSIRTTADVAALTAVPVVGMPRVRTLLTPANGRAPVTTPGTLDRRGG
jgi:uncharacterized protein involved in exopolysaccharide biosynthesis